MGTIDIAKKNILTLKEFDKNGDRFRYPFTYSFDHIQDIECEMRTEYEPDIKSEWESKMRSYCDGFY